MPDKNGDEKLLYSAAETARLLSISTKTLREFVRAGEIVYVPLGRGRTKPRLGFHLDDINDFVKGRRVREPLPATTRTVRTTSIHQSPVYSFMALREQRNAEKQAKKNKK
ncbi:helix-turn-helix domain-containing protein [Mycoplana rhizolycopersici]|uniref:Helix-turn-helix domain-containing protein n=1 Tax=Mycoplana rhizolycopersici TaxID=2746702 RepID=A0ABX2QHX4_9HYPH|nr:helix-turn-helix domain-containing protein [Rhizobium rhizolycopersici]NVP55949.1 helix-turn-helix domain-containing protein [Rhizobium rhizolycopersici]